MKDTAFIDFLEELGILVGMSARYGGAILIYNDGSEVKVIYAKDEKVFKEACNKVKKNTEWLNEELLNKEMLSYAENTEINDKPESQIGVL